MVLSAWSYVTVPISYDSIIFRFAAQEKNAVDNLIC